MLRLPPLRATLAVAAAVVLAACSTPPWQEGSAGDSASPTAETSPSATGTPAAAGSPSASSSATISTVKNDLASGSVHKTLKAGSITVNIDYWSTLAMGDWTPDANKPLSMAVTASLPKGTPAKQGVFLSKVTITPTVKAGETTATAPGPISDDSTVSPGYTVRKPSSYQQVFTLPSLDPSATSVSLQINYELLLQTTPTSKEYAKQTASDTLTIALA